MVVKGQSWAVLAAVAVTGFASGLPLLLTSATLQAWFSEAGIDLLTIGALSLVGLPYLCKVIWAPWCDRVCWRFFGLDQRRSWIFLSQLIVALGLVGMAGCDPQQHSHGLAWMAFIVALASATQDTVIDAYRIDILPSTDRGLGASLSTVGYRLALVLGGGLALIFADHLGWRATYLVMAAIMGALAVATVVMPAGGDGGSVGEGGFLQPWHSLWRHLPRPAVMLMFIAVVKFPDALVLVLGPTFLLRHVGLNLSAVGGLYKVGGIVVTLVGSLVAGVWLQRGILYRGLWWFLVSEVIAVGGYVAVASVRGVSVGWVAVCVLVECFCNGLLSTGIIALLMGLVQRQYTAAQFALLTAVGGLGRVLLGPIAGWVVVHSSWGVLFSCGVVSGLLALVLLWFLKDTDNGINTPSLESTLNT